jgi:hypothetical protein
MFHSDKITMVTIHHIHTDRRSGGFTGPGGGGGVCCAMRYATSRQRPGNAPLFETQRIDRIQLRGF